MSTDEGSATNDLDGFRPVIPANRYYLNHMLKHVERCIDAVDQWLVDRKSKRSEVMAQLASEVMPQVASQERASIPVFDLPELWLPASVESYLPELPHEPTLAAIHADVEEARSKCERIESPQKLYELILKSERKVATLVRVYVRPYEQLRLEIWTRLQQLDLFEFRKGGDVPADLINLPNALTVEQMAEQWFSGDPESSISSFTIRGTLGLTVNLIERTVERSGFVLAGKTIKVEFASKTMQWIPFIISFFSNRSGVDAETSKELCDTILQRHSRQNFKDRNKRRQRYIREANSLLGDIKVKIGTNWGLHPTDSGH